MVDSLEEYFFPIILIIFGISLTLHASLWANCMVSSEEKLSSVVARTKLHSNLHILQSGNLWKAKIKSFRIGSRDFFLMKN